MQGERDRREFVERRIRQALAEKTRREIRREVEEIEREAYGRGRAAAAAVVVALLAAALVALAAYVL